MLTAAVAAGTVHAQLDTLLSNASAQADQQPNEAARAWLQIKNATYAALEQFMAR